jgi:hypothetical protein
LVVIGIVVLILLAREIYVPDDFGTHERGYMYSYHRSGNVDEWKAFAIKYQGTEYCQGCHEDKTESLSASPHTMIPCENCHGAALDHPDDPEKLVIDRSRDLCLRCHAALTMPGSGRRHIPGIDPQQHNTDIECSACHNPHNPNLAEI